MITPTFEDVLQHEEAARKYGFNDRQSPEQLQFYFAWVFPYLSQVKFDRNFGRYLYSGFYHEHPARNVACIPDASSRFGYECIRNHSHERLSHTGGYPYLEDVIRVVNSDEGREFFKLRGDRITYLDLAVIGLSELQAYAITWTGQRLLYNYRVFGTQD